MCIRDSYGWYVDDVNVYACEGFPTGVTLSSVAARPESPAPFASAIPLVALPLASGLALAAAYVARRRRL